MGKKQKIFVAMSPKKSLRDLTGQAGLKQKVFVAMSGGVDSSVSAALLKKQGFEVVGVFMRLNNNSESAERSAHFVAKKLGIDFLVFDLQKDFKRKVVEPFLKEAKEGKTPNPCVICNPQIKFGLFLQKAFKLKAQLVATGHYVKLKNKRLYQGKDSNKDQSYFLYRLDKKQLSKIIFPLGDFKKEQVVKMAKKMKLPYEQKESFDICFVPDYRKFLRHGKIVDLEGKKLGEHRGLALYTIGQRANIGGPGPFFVVRKDTKKNLLIASNKEQDLFSREFLVKNVNWINKIKLPAKAEVKIRYRSKSEPAKISKKGSQLKVEFMKPQRAITPGQSAVFYKGGEVLGGGIIV